MRKVQFFVSVAAAAINLVGALVVAYGSGIEIRDNIDLLHADLSRQGHWLFIGAVTSTSTTGPADCSLAIAAAGLRK
jgi:hypothetical protein